MSSSFQSGSVLGGRYRIDREIGRGGMAVVYSAWDETLERHVAVKVLAASVTGTSGIDRFLDEIRTTAGLAHPNILTLLDSGSVDAAPFYVTNLVRGESLRERLARESVLSMDEALRIGATLAGALAHAHAEGVIHRDVKPGNVLLDRGANPYLADFGIARVVSKSADLRRTGPHQVVGTLQYASPEQLSPGSEVDGATDVYALGCLIFETLAGTPPFSAATPSALVAAHVLTPPPSLRERRADAPRELDELLRNCLAKDRTSRKSAAELAARLEDIRVAERARLSPSDPEQDAAPHAPALWRRLAFTGLAAVFVGAAAFGLAAALRAIAPLEEVRDSVYAVLPFDVNEEVALRVPVESLLEAALGRWQGISVVNGLQVEALATRMPNPRRLSLDETRVLARGLRVGRVVTGTARADGDSILVEASLRDPGSSGQPMRRLSFVISRDARLGDSLVARAAETILFGVVASEVGSRPTGTMSVPARLEYDAGQLALDEWDLASAASRFAASATHDPYFDLALLWKAQALNWQGSLTQSWEADARRAARAAAEWAPRERYLATGLAAIADRDYPAACASYVALRDLDPSDFAAWFGIGECNGDDPLVVRDTTSRTGWGFRGSAHAAATAYRTAFELLPASYRAFGAGVSERLSALLYARRGVARQGRAAAPDSRTFVGWLEWSDSTLSFVALPLDSVLFHRPDSNAQAEALTRQRAALLQVANTWVRAFPGSSGAQYTLGVARDLVGYPNAIDAYREARRIPGDVRVRAMAAMGEVMLRVRTSIPHDITGLRAAAALGDSVLADVASGRVQELQEVAQLAVLLGRPSLAARLSRASEIGGGLGGFPNDLVREAEGLLAFAAVGAPADSLAAVEALVERLIRQSVSADSVLIARRSLLELPSFLAFPAHTFQFLDNIEQPRLPEARAIAALVAGNPGRALEVLGRPPETPGWDVTLARSNVLVAIGRSSEALEFLSDRLRSLATSDPAELTEMNRVGALVRVAALRAELEHEFGSPVVAADWARVVDVLWGEGEESVGPVLERMRRMLDAG